MLKTTGSSDKPAFNRRNGSKSVSSRNNNSRLAFRSNNSNSKVDGYGVNGNGMEYAKKSGKLSKSRKLKSKKTFKSQNLAKLRKKLSKSRNLTNINATEDGPKFLTFNARTTFNRLRLAFIEALIL